MGVSIEQILATYPGISQDPDISTYVELAKTQTSSCFYGSRYNEAVALRAAHNLVMSKPLEYADKKTGGITSKKQKSISVEYGQKTSSGKARADGLDQTTYGTQLLALMRMSQPTIGVTNGISICGV